MSTPRDDYMPEQERILDVFPQGDEQRLVVLARTDDSNASTAVILRQQSLSDAGWFTQNEIALAQEQIPGLKLFFSGSTTRFSQPCWPSATQTATIPFAAKGA